MPERVCISMEMSHDTSGYMPHDTSGNADVDICLLSGDVFDTVQMSRSATVGSLPQPEHADPAPQPRQSRMPVHMPDSPSKDRMVMTPCTSLIDTLRLGG